VSGAYIYIHGSATGLLYIGVTNNLYLRVMQHKEGTWEIQCVSQQILLSGIGGRKAPSRMGKMSTAEVLRLRATSAVSRDKSERRSAQDDDSVGCIDEKHPKQVSAYGTPLWLIFSCPRGTFSEGPSHRGSLRLVEPIDWPYCFGDGWNNNGAK
jgi:hypothetical protein